MTYAGFWRRFMAVVIDTLIILIPSWLLGYALPYIGGVVVGLAYFPVFEASSAQATPGKYIMGLKVAQENGQRLDFLKAVGRYLLKTVSGLILCIGYIMQLFTAKRQTLHDMLMGAVVVRHNYSEAPDWFHVWMQQMRYILRAEERPASQVGANTIGDLQSAHDTGMSSSASSSTGASVDHTAEALSSIEKLHELYKQGALSEDEYQAKKAELLKQV